MTTPYWRLFVGFLFFSACAFPQGDVAFQGDWSLDPTRSENANSPEFHLHVEQSARELKVVPTSRDTMVRRAPRLIPLDGSATRFAIDNQQWNTRTKWEGDALLVNTLVSGQQSYAIDERWTKSRDGRTLTVVRTVIRASSETETILVYGNSAAASSPVTQHSPKIAAPATVSMVDRTTPPETTQVPAVPSEFVVNRGTRILMRLTNAVNTRHTVTGDRVYLQTAVPVFVDRRLVIPAGSYVTGIVIESTRAGRVKGKSALDLRFESITLPNGITRDLSSRAGSVDGAGDLDRSEGRIKGEGNKSGDARTVGETTAAGAGIGTLAGAAAGNWGLGAGIGAAAGAAAGLAGVLGGRGPDVILHPGTTMEFVLDRDLRFTNAELIESASK